MPVALSLRPHHAGRYRDLALLLVKYGRSDLVQAAGLDTVLRDEVGGPEQQVHAEELAADLEALGPTFVKLGQLLSSRVDLLPEPYIDALARLQDQLDPVPFDQVEQIISGELGTRLSRAFAEFDPVPLASASLGQVHRARLRTGESVVVKVQRPDVRRQVAEDMDVLCELAEFLDAHSEAAARMALTDLLEEFRRSLVSELDYQLEAANLVRLAEILAPYDRLVVPRPYDGFCTGRVLTMQRLDGHKVTELSGVVLTDVDGDTLADQLFRAYLDQILVAGFFHADPHAGNVLLMPDGRLAVLDVGQVARLNEDLRGQLVRTLLAVADGNGAEVAALSAAMCEQLPGYDERRFTRQVTELVERTARAGLLDMRPGEVVLRLTQLCAAADLRPPPELAMVGKALLHLDEVAGVLAPDFQAIDVFREHTVTLVRSGMRPSVGGLVTTMLETKDFVEQLPGRVNRAMDAFADGRMEFRVKAFDEQEFLAGLHRMANRVAMGVVVAALVVGAAILSQVRTSTTVAGYPAVAFVVFCVAAIAGLALIVSIVLSDRRVRARYRRPRRKRH